jgi:hypothetical protein
MDQIKTDGRDIDSAVALLSGEASEQVTTAHTPAPAKAEPWPAVPGAPQPDVTYYGRPLLKQSVWSIDIPLYYFAGGAAGAALVLGAAMQAGGRASNSRELRELSAICHWIGIAGSTAGAALLVHDLGRPARFLYMMRVFRPTSPMNMGAWILAGAAPTAILTGLCLNRRGWLGAVGEAAGYASGVFGAALSGYTGVLVANSAIPVWQEARRWMPVLFAASAASTTAGLLEVFYEGRHGSRITQVFGAIGRSAELAAASMAQSSASAVPRVGLPFHRGRGASLWKAASALTAASLALSLLPARRRPSRRLAGALAAAGSLCLRFAVHYISQSSALDARASFDRQRAVPATSDASRAPKPRL